MLFRSIDTANVDSKRRYLQKWALDYLGRLARGYFEYSTQLEQDAARRNLVMRFFLSPKETRLKITSMVRPMELQKEFATRGNQDGRRSAADCSTAEKCSTHLTGATFDISFKPMNQKQRAFIEQFLLRDQGKKIYAVMEPRSGCYHVFVFNVFGLENDKKIPARHPRRKKHQTHHLTPTR